MESEVTSNEAYTLVSNRITMQKPGYDFLHLRLGLFIWSSVLTFNNVKELQMVYADVV